MTEPSTKILDHIVHLTPPGSVSEVSDQFQKLGFNVLPGGTHADGLTANALVVLQDGTYLELIAFTHPASHYPPSSPIRAKRDAHAWARKPSGWIDYAFLGSSYASITEIINKRAEAARSGVHYLPEMKGGRERPDGKILEWLIAAPSGEHGRGVVPFYCGDITPRKLRVPLEPPSNAYHPSSASGIAFVRVLVEPEKLLLLSRQLTSVVGVSAHKDTAVEVAWPLEHQVVGGANPKLILGIAQTAEEEEKLAADGSGIYEVGFWVDRDREEGSVYTPHGKISWLHKGV